MWQSMETDGNYELADVVVGEVPLVRRLNESTCFPNSAKFLSSRAPVSVDGLVQQCWMPKNDETLGIGKIISSQAGYRLKRNFYVADF